MTKKDFDRLRHEQNRRLAEVRAKVPSWVADLQSRPLGVDILGEIVGAEREGPFMVLTGAGPSAKKGRSKAKAVKAFSNIDDCEAYVQGLGETQFAVVRLLWTGGKPQITADGVELWTEREREIQRRRADADLLARRGRLEQQEDHQRRVAAALKQAAESAKDLPLKLSPIQSLPKAKVDPSTPGGGSFR